MNNDWFAKAQYPHNDIRINLWYFADLVLLISSTRLPLEEHNKKFSGKFASFISSMRSVILGGMRIYFDEQLYLTVTTLPRGGCGISSSSIICS